MNETYEPDEIEQAAQEYWKENHSFEVKEDLSKEKFYCLSMLPYPSGELHMGHVRNYTIGDVISRYQIQKGKNVLQPMGWDAFGLPAGNAAIQHKLPPAEWTRKNIKKMRKQFQQLGFAYDWRREIRTCDPRYYRWEQWLFLKLYEKKLVYKKDAIVNWDPVDETVLANEQVVDGCGWRSGVPIEHRKMSQWFLRITHYAEELLNDLDELKNWPKQVITMQRNWIGRSKGVVANFSIEKHHKKIEIFTTRPDTIMGVTYIAIAPEHPLAIEAAESNKEIYTLLKKYGATKVAEAEITTQEKEGVFLGLHATHPITKEKLPIWITNFVLIEYGTGAIMAVPAHDERDHEFALKYSLPIKPVIKPPNDSGWDFQVQAYTNHGKLINCAQFDGIDSKEAINVISEYLKKNKLGEPKTHYRLRDWGISRQRYWGTPIPIINCKQCGIVPVPEADLPVILPEDIIPTGHGSPLKSKASFYKTTCPKCGKAATRETDTMDTFVESAWYYARYCCNDQEKTMLDDRAKYWTPVDQYIGGIEHAVMHLLYARFMHKILRDQGLLNSNEPFTRLLTQGMVLKDGAKMSKSKGNVVVPLPLIKKYGADTVRLFSIFAAPPDQNLEWSDTGVEGAYRFLKKLWSFAHRVCKTMQTMKEQEVSKNHYEVEDPELQKKRKQLHDYLRQANQDIDRLQFNTVVSACMKILNLIMKLSPDEEQERTLIYEGLNILLCLLAPITPHISHKLWQELDFGKNILKADWPKHDARVIQVSYVEMVVQINGKLRGRIQVSPGADKANIKNIALNQENIQRHLLNKQLKKVIIVPKKLINIVV